jgi:hypothetical protein
MPGPDLTSTASAIGSRAALTTQADTDTGRKNVAKMSDSQAKDWAQSEHDTRSDYQVARAGRR